MLSSIYVDQAFFAKANTCIIIYRWDRGIYVIKQTVNYVFI